MKKTLSILIATLVIVLGINIVSACESLCNCGCKEGKPCICNKDNKIGVTSCVCPKCGTEVACSGKGRCFCPCCDKVFRCSGKKFKLFFLK